MAVLWYRVMYSTAYKKSSNARAVQEFGGLQKGQNETDSKRMFYMVFYTCFFYSRSYYRLVEMVLADNGGGRPEAKAAADKE